MKNKVLVFLLICTVLLTSCSKDIVVEITEIKHFFPEVSHDIELKTVKVNSDGKGVVGFNWTNKNDKTWSFNGSGIEVFATQEDDTVSEIDVLSPSFKTKVNPKETFYVSFDLKNISLESPLNIHFLPLEGDEYIVTIDLKNKTYKDATKKDNKKSIGVFNFRPSDDWELLEEKNDYLNFQLGVNKRIVFQTQAIEKPFENLLEAEEACLYSLSLISEKAESIGGVKKTIIGNQRAFYEDLRVSVDGKSKYARQIMLPAKSEVLSILLVNENQGDNELGFLSSQDEILNNININYSDRLYKK